MSRTPACPEKIPRRSFNVLVEGRFRITFVEKADDKSLSVAIRYYGAARKAVIAHKIDHVSSEAPGLICVKRRDHSGTYERRWERMSFVPKGLNVNHRVPY